MPYRITTDNRYENRESLLPLSCSMRHTLSRLPTAVRCDPSRTGYQDLAIADP